MHALTTRQTRLLETLKAESGVISAGRVHEINRSLGAPKRATARRDLTALHRRGLLIQGGADDRRFYLLTRKATP
ncbi:hypothetical protein ABZ819_04895 [Streptomyces venezuelae]|uniref:hypothetical protein n=1 Tax=Streptomyces venezuelae TaxID=54571 RepID=UPI003431C40E